LDGRPDAFIADEPLTPSAHYSVCGGQEPVAYRWRGQYLDLIAEARETVRGG